MKQFFLLLLSCTFLLVSCEKDAADQLAIDLEILEKYLDDNNIPALKDPSGVYYLITEEGEGEENPTPSSTVIMYYQMSLLDGTVVENWQTQPEEQIMGNLLFGWQKGLTYFKKGGKGKIYIPSLLAYGEFGVRGYIPGNSILILEVDLINFF